MSGVIVPSTDKTGAYAKQAEITTLAARTDTFSVQLCLQRQIELINTLVSQGKLNASSILSTVPYRGSNPFVTSNPAQAVTELLNSGQLSASLVLSTMSYIGGAAN